MDILLLTEMCRPTFYYMDMESRSLDLRNKFPQAKRDPQQNNFIRLL